MERRLSLRIDVFRSVVKCGDHESICFDIIVLNKGSRSINYDPIN